MSASSDPSPWFFSNLSLVISNLAFILPAAACWKFGKYFPGALFLCPMFFSAFYHACKWGTTHAANFGGYCIFGASFEALYAADFFSSQITVAVLAVFFVSPKVPTVSIEERYEKDFEKHRRDAHPRVSKRHEYSVVFPRDAPVLEGDRPVWFDLPGPASPGEEATSPNRDDVPKLWCDFCNVEVSLSRSEKGGKVVEFEGSYYAETSDKKKKILFACESLYLVWHVFVIPTSLRMVGPSLIYVTLPLLIANASVVAILLIGSVLLEAKVSVRKRSNALVGRSERYARVYGSTNDPLAVTGEEEETKIKNGSWLGKEMWNRLERRPRLFKIAYAILPNRSILGADVLKSIELGPDFPNPALPSERRFFPGTRVRRRNVFAIVAVAVLGAVAVTLYAAQNGRERENYYWMHDLWHLLGALGYFAFVAYVA